MACCIITAYVMNRIIKACEVLNLDILNMEYNEFDDGPTFDRKDDDSKNTLTVSKLSIEGMTCTACITSIESALKSLRGVEAVSVSLPLSRASIVHDAQIVPVSDIVATIESRGYGAQPGERTAQQNFDLARQTADLERLRTAFTNSASLASLMVTVDWMRAWTSHNSTSGWLLTYASACLGLWVQLLEAEWIHSNAWRRGRPSVPTMDTLISLSLLLGLTLSAFNMLLSGLDKAKIYFSSGSFLTVVVIGGRYVDTLLRRQTASSLAQLYSMQSEATLVKLYQSSLSQCSNDTNKQQRCSRVPTLALRPGDEILIDPGNLIPCDCYITSGTSIVDQAAMTGEFMFVTKAAGDFLISGTRNLTCELRAVVSKPQGDSALEQLISTVTAATEDQAVEGAPEILSSFFVRLIIFIAICATCATYVSCDRALSLSDRITTAGERAMAILASACPCALGLAAPSAPMSGMSAAWSRGVILRGGSSAINKLDSLTHVVMDKTGTLTTGKLSIVQVEGDITHSHCMMIAAAERQDAWTHPVAKTLFQWSLLQLADEQRTQQHRTKVTDLLSDPGKGVSCTATLPDAVESSVIHLGTAAFFREHNISTEGCSTDKPSRNEIAVHLAVNHCYIATLYLRDTIRPEAPQVIAALQRLSLSITMLTGDTQDEAQHVSQTLGIPVLSARALPHEKQAFITKLQSQSQRVAMVGDGLNDTPVLSAADVGILCSPGLSRSNATQTQVADVILTTPNLTRLVDAILIARKTVKQIRWNVRWAVSYNVVSVALAAGALEHWGVRIDAITAGSMMAFSSVSVVAWSLWFRRQLGHVS